MVAKAKFTARVLYGLQRWAIEEKEGERKVVQLQYEWTSVAREHKAQAYRKKYRSRRK